MHCLDGLQADLQRHYPQICTQAAAHQRRAPPREEPAWALEQVEQILQRRRQHEREPVTAPCLPHAQAAAVGVLAAGGAGLLALSLL